MITMQAIKLIVYQQTANYRVPVSHGFRETYPLPPYSTVIGMVHYLCNFDCYHPMEVSIQGKSGSATSDLFTRYEFKNGMKFDAKRHQLNVEGFGVSRGIGHVQLLVDVNLMIHIVPQNQEEIQTIYEALSHPREYPTIGRREDLAVFESVKVVNLESKQLTTDYEVKDASYIPQPLLQNKEGEDAIGLTDENRTSLQRGTIYDLDKDYTLVETSRHRFERRWNKVPAMYVSNFKMYEGEQFLFDEENDPVFVPIASGD